MAFSLFAQKKVEWISSTEVSQWVSQKGLTAGLVSGKPDVEILLDKPLQTIEGFGACFNELGWTSLNSLGKTDCESIVRELFSPGVGGNFTICHMPVAICTY